MPVYRHILFATDLTEETYALAYQVKALARATEATLSLIHVVEPVPPYVSSYLLLGNITQDIEKNANQMLAKLGTELQVEPTQQHVCIGNTRDEIIKLAQTLQADLIVLGKHGAKGFSLLLGSTASGVLAHAKCDVLVYPLPNG